MWWRLTNSQFEEQKGEANREALKEIVDSREVPGLLAYLPSDGEEDEREPVGWCSIAPRKSFSKLSRSRILKAVDDQPVWSIVCFFVAKPHRGKGVTHRLIKAAIDYARIRGAKIVEAYPVDPKKDRAPDVFVYTGLASTFSQAGFGEELRRSETRPIMRYYL
jgi:GNAT superfamily N-acetyltransferase